MKKEYEMYEDLERYYEILKRDDLTVEDINFFAAGVVNLEKQLTQIGFFRAQNEAG